ncbi:MAG: hypothetical protein U0T07_03635 [Chitinophagales bacterium]
MIEKIKKIIPKNKIEMLCFFFIGYILFVRIIYLFSKSIDLGGMEFSFIYQQQFIDKHNVLYLNPDNFPFYISFYPPLYPYLMKVLLAFFNINVYTDISNALILGRLLSLTSLFFVIYFILKIIRFISVNISHKYLLCLIFILLLPEHFYTFRPDSLKVLCFIIFLFFMLQYNFGEQTKRNLIFATSAAIIGIYTKHDIIIYIAMYFGVQFIMSKKIKDIIPFLIILLTTACLFVCMYLLKGNLILKNLFFYNIQYGNDAKLSILLILINIVRLFPLLLLSIINTKSKNVLIQFIAWYAILLFFTSSILLLRSGANLNYTYEVVIVMIINAGIYIQQKNFSYYKTTIAYVFLLLLMCNKISYKLVHFGEDIEKWKAQYSAQQFSSKAIANIIKNDVVFFPEGKQLVFNGKLNTIFGYDLHLERFTSLYLNTSIKSRILNNHSTADYDKLFTNGFVKYIVIEDNKNSLEQMNTYYPLYHFQEKQHQYLIYTFKDK